MGDSTQLSRGRRGLAGMPGCRAVSLAAGAGPQDVSQDRQLAGRCLAGEPGAWDLLYAAFHPGLLATIKRRLGRGKCDPNLVDEIAARVWYALVADGGRRLACFDATRGCRLSTYLAELARTEIGGLFRSERRRRTREQVASRPEIRGGDQGGGLSRGEICELFHQLSPREREFLDDCLLCLNQRQTDDRFSAANRWQLACRVQRKLRRLLAS